MVLRQLLAAAAALVFLCGPGLAGGDEVRYVEQNGVLYRQTQQVVQRPVVETRMVETTRTVYREELTTEMRETPRTYWTPVTEYRCESYIANRWNPLGQALASPIGWCRGPAGSAARRRSRCP